MLVARLRRSLIHRTGGRESAFDQRQGVDLALCDIHRLRLFQRVQIPQARLRILFLSHILVDVTVFYVDQFEGGFDAPVEQTITNSNGYSEVYKVYKSNNANLGTTTVDIREV